MDEGNVAALARALDGRVVTAGDKGYDSLRKPWLKVIEQRPALIVEAASAGDVAAAVRFARDHRLELGVTATGHGIAAACDGGLLLHLHRMTAVAVDPGRRRATVGPGVTGGALLAAIEPHGLTYPSGQVTSVGVTGYALGGGTGWLVRKLGPACDAVTGADVVLADGTCVHASADEHADLFWALRGGGGNFGVVVALELELAELPDVFGGELFYPIGRAAEVLRVYRDWAGTLSDETSTIVRLIAPPVGHLPDALKGLGVCMIGVCHADPATGPEVVRPLDVLGTPLFRTMKRRPLSGMAGLDPASHMPGAASYDHAEYVRALPDDAIERIVRAVHAKLPPVMQAELQHLGGAFARSGAVSAFEPTRAPFQLHLTTPANPLESMHTIADATRAFVADLDGLFTGGAYYNYLRGDERDRIPHAFGAKKYARLRALKGRYDPDNVFRLNLNIPPQAAPGAAGTPT